jgi:hypothetical protein
VTLLLEKMAMFSKLLSQSYVVRRGYCTLWILFKSNSSELINYVLQQQIKA